MSNTDNQQQLAQLLQRDRAAAWVITDQSGRQYSRDIIDLSSTTVAQKRHPKLSISVK